MLENLTVILFTRNRFEKASVVIRFWLNRGAQVLLLDASSQTELKQQFGAKTNLVYFRAESFWERALFASKNICTKYALIHSDDSLVVPSAINKGISILEKEEQVGFLYAPGNFTSWWFEDSSWEFGKKMIGENAYQRMLYWAKNPNDLMWGALWRSADLEKALAIWGKSTSVFPFETNLHTTSLYLAGAALTTGRLMKGPLHLSRHWSAPEDKTFEVVRSMKSPIGIDVRNQENQHLFILWKESFLESLNRHLSAAETIDLHQLNQLLEKFEKNEPNQGLLLSGNIKISQRIREKSIIELKKYERKQSRYSSIARGILYVIRQIKLKLNYMKKRRCGWFRFPTKQDFTNQELIDFGIQSEEFSELNIQNYSKLFVE